MTLKNKLNSQKCAAITIMFRNYQLSTITTLIFFVDRYDIKTYLSYTQLFITTRKEIRQLCYTEFQK